ncbi:MAG: hypothetical protein NTU57_02970 [Candidatus Aenigmarchaeota archaeon]|nr:hypothetical protein [Candidatus Aenigmarchaeota archaeon]
MGKYKMVHLGDSSRDDKAFQYASRFPQIDFYSISKGINESISQRHARSKGVGNCAYMEGDFIEGLGKIPDGSVNGVYSNMAVGYYNNGFNSGDYHQRLFELVLKKLASGGKFSFSIHEDNAVSNGNGAMNKKIIIEMLKNAGFDGVEARPFHEAEYGRTYWTDFYGQKGKKAFQISAGKARPTVQL